jgi:hypothetical protein
MRERNKSSLSVNVPPLTIDEAWGHILDVFDVGVVR